MTSVSRLQVELSPITREDFEDIAHAHLAAMKNDAVYLRMSPLSQPPSFEVQIQHNIHSRTSRPFPNPPPAFEIKATLPGSSKPIGFAYWGGPVDRMATLGGPSAEEALAGEQNAVKEKTEEEKEIDQTLDLNFLQSFRGQQANSKREIMQGKACWYLGMLFVHPEYQGLGVASALLDFGISRADEAGLPCYLESSLKGRAVYASKGFKIVRMMEVDDENEEGGKFRWPAMLRPPRPVDVKP